MDPITTAIVAALSAGALSGLTEMSKTALTDAYARLKTLLTKKFGGESEVVHAVNGVEAKPDSAGRQATLQEEVAAAKADQDQEVLHAAQALLQLLQASAEGGQHMQTATGSYIAQADRGSSASVTVGNQPEH
jgi:HetE-like protein